MLFAIDYSIEDTLRKPQGDDNGNVAKQKHELYTITCVIILAKQQREMTKLCVV